MTSDITPSTFDESYDSLLRKFTKLTMGYPNLNALLTVHYADNEHGHLALQELIELVETCEKIESSRVVSMFVGEISTPDLHELIEATRPVFELHKSLVNLPKDKRHRAKLIQKHEEALGIETTNSSLEHEGEPSE